MKLRFSNRFTNELPADPVEGKHNREVRQACYSVVPPTPTSSPTLIAFASEVADQLGLTDADLTSQTFINVMTGNELLPGMLPHAACYGGHQFGNWAGQLGDGRAIALGEVQLAGGDHLTLQLKGSGPTPYSRGADGYAVLRSSVREFLCSEAMFNLGVPTTRALSLALTGDEVVRDMLYDGHPAPEPGAIVCRVAPSFLRFGSFELFSSRGEFIELRQLLDFSIRTDFPHLGAPSPKAYLAWFREVSTRTAELVVHWMRVGFVHGVMNTDNLSVLGLTIDFGPYGWVEDYDPGWTPNTTDRAQRRYRFGAQAKVAQWNLAQLGNAIYPIIAHGGNIESTDDDRLAEPDTETIEELQSIVTSFAKDYDAGFQLMMAAKLGLPDATQDADASAGSSEQTLTQQALAELITGVDTVLGLVETDMTIFYRCLAQVPIEALSDDDNDLVARIGQAHYVKNQVSDDVTTSVAAWLREYLTVAKRMGLSDSDRRDAMNLVNPKFVLRNYLAQLAIDAAETGDYSLIHELQLVLKRPYDEQPEFEHLAAKRPDWARTRVGCSQLSCSS